ncbi:hypothetical protein AWC30_10180 [Mycolicibacillus trivialis]|uniref:Proline-rich 28 kDa antigen n=2 Tax=Mycolicibacillus trivialis TaxID=1798 RepID=A0A1X2EJL7_9MYCO|nr:LpqN/LpqT family lipoprotein [Mycolicibacillus trivialis]ORX04140.1 hypothetical protein AWC30_10180 [Mycolicibacillus trivialis]
MTRTRSTRRWPVVAAVSAVAIGFGAGVAAADPLPPSPSPAPVAPDALAQRGPVGPATLPPAGPAALPTAAPAAQPPAPALAPATAETLREFLEAKGVEFQPQVADGFEALDITLPVPPGWTQVPDPNVPDAFVVLADRSTNSIYTSNAQLVVYKLVGDFDTAAAIAHGNVKTQQLPAWRTTDQALENANGFPCSRIEGTYRQNDMTLNTARRTVLATSGADRYLVSLAVTTEASVAIAEAAATDAIATGFTVSPPAPARPPGPVPQTRPATPGLTPAAPGAVPSRPGPAPAAPATPPVAAAPAAPNQPVIQPTPIN